MDTVIFLGELTSIALEGDRYRVRFTDPKNRANLVDMLVTEPPALKIGSKFTLTAHEEPKV